MMEMFYMCMFDGCVTRTTTCSQTYEVMVIESIEFKVWFVFIGETMINYVYNVVSGDNSIFRRRIEVYIASRDGCRCRGG